MDAKRRKLNDNTTRIIIKSSKTGLMHEKVKNLVEKLLKCEVARSVQMEGFGKDGDSDGNKSGVILVFTARDVALRTLDLDYKLEEVLGIPISITEHIDRRKKVHEFRLKDRFKDAFESDSDEEKKEKGPKRSFKKTLHSEFEERVTVNKVKTICVTRCPATMRDQKVVREKFEQCGTIRNVVLRTDASGMFKGTAFIEFVTEDGAAAAVKTMNMKLVDGNRIRVHEYSDNYAMDSNGVPAYDKTIINKLNKK